jgi:hypothetical protein
MITLCNVVSICILLLQLQYGYKILASSRMQLATRLSMKKGHEIGYVRASQIFL